MSRTRRGPVLLAGGGAGQAHGPVSAARILAAAGHEVHATSSDRYSALAWSRHVRRTVQVPSVADPAFATQVRALERSGRYRAVLATSDAALIALGRPEAALVDKDELTRRVVAAGLPWAEEHSFPDGTELIAAAHRLTFPLVVKSVAKHGAGDLPVQRYDGPAGLAGPGGVAGVTTPLVTQGWLEGPQVALSGVVWQGRFRALARQRYLRTWPRDCGVSAEAVTIAADPEQEARLLELVRDHDGVFQIQLIGDHVIDVNPRIFGSVALSAGAGVNLPDLALRLAAGDPLDGPGVRPPDPDGVIRVPPGLRYRWLEGHVRSVAEELRHGGEVSAAMRALAGSRGTVHGDVRLSDPGPTLARLAHLARSRRNRGT